MKIKCDQCEMLSINGAACHEHGCPNKNARYDPESQEWVKQYECFKCGYIADVGSNCCHEEEYD